MEPGLDARNEGRWKNINENYTILPQQVVTQAARLVPLVGLAAPLTTPAPLLGSEPARVHPRVRPSRLNTPYLRRRLNTTNPLQASWPASGADR